jgi:hypothetical protein
MNQLLIYLDQLRESVLSNKDCCYPQTKIKELETAITRSFEIPPKEKTITKKNEYQEHQV